jgi:hypothetical protein
LPLAFRIARLFGKKLEGLFEPDREAEPGAERRLRRNG